MALADDLLLQARDLANWGESRPRQASLRRSVSTAYYALFHLLVQDAAKRLSPGSPNGLTQQIGRAFVHGDMKQACKSITAQPTSVLLTLRPQGFSLRLQSVAGTFVNLQEQRHAADYDLTRTYTRIDVLNVVDTAQDAFADWRNVRRTAEANVFCAALLFHRTWGR
ncbi:hypothetical protein [Granulicella tundricola]|uniref:HEPN domain-containing protein n=1 Tax=Granulicella tundricola (strain ATCC BAA-1859 / DSM 23138 / MP5ACTX9) TaxID=1198114 RepID=E8WW19_GRATM|nr:hypothetical protein [Granulicella tundricola]ADW67325.1 hypothetical protein AciX9_0251 [Granulicella tundricola MP5ACTX9]